MPGFLLRGPPARLCVGLACVLSLWNTVSAFKGEAKKENAMTFLPTTVSGNKEVKKENDEAFLGATELPARSVDLSALNLTELVNGMLSRALKESTKFFSLLSITSYSSFAFHKFAVAIYNISHLRPVDLARFPARYCYCLNNGTNDLSDFTALLVDITGNSTSYLTEIFKSTSILSVSQMNESDCIFICVMTGKSGRNFSDFWEMAEKSPVINYTFTSSMPGVLATRGMAGTSQLTPTSPQTLPGTSPLHGPQSTGVSAPRTSSRTETTPPSEGGQTVNTDGLPELLTRATTRATATPGSASSTLPALATGKVAGTPRVTAHRQAWASTLPVLRAQVTREKTPGGPPWETLSSTPASAESEEAMSTRNLSWSPARTVAAPDSPSWTSLTSDTPTPGTQTPRPTKAPAPRYPQTGDVPAGWPFTPGEAPAVVPGPHQVSRFCIRTSLSTELLRNSSGNHLLALHLTEAQDLEFLWFTQHFSSVWTSHCPFVCGASFHKKEIGTKYCLEYYSWFLKNATYICQRVKRVSRSHTLKQKCLENICKSV